MKHQIKTNAGNPMMLGVNKIDDGYNFAVVSSCDMIYLNLYHKGGSVPLHSICLDERFKFGDIFAVSISGIDFDNLEYNYTIDGKCVLDSYARQVCDVYDFGNSIREKDYRTKVASENFDWGDDKYINTPFEETIIYKMHVRGFTKHVSSKVKSKGTFAGIAEKIPYLKELGITAVELMPIHEFEEVQKWTPNNKMTLYNPQFNGKINYWGYTRGLYFAPKAAYSTGSSKNGDYTVEFKKLVKKLHEESIEVILEMYFPEDVGLNMIRDCIRYWVAFYHIDGVHINCSQAVLEAVANDPLLSRIKILTDYWNVGDKRRTCKNLANYNHGFMHCARRLLKGDENQLYEFTSRFKANDSNVATINYVANSNTMTLMDLVSFDRKHNEENGENNRDGEDFNHCWNCGIEGKTRKKKILELRNKQIKNALLMVLLSQGTPLIMAGDEFGNSQNGNNNPYCQDNEISWLNWRNLETNKEIFEYTKALIRFRKEHGVLHQKDKLKDFDYKSCGYPDISYHGDNAWYTNFENYNRHMGIMLAGNYGYKSDDTRDDSIYIGYNLHWEKHRLALPYLDDDKEWEVVFDSSGISRKEGVDSENTVSVEPRSIVVLVSKKSAPKASKKDENNNQKK